ncbi:MAG: twin-arginine translocation signal domain-containing protein [Rhodospirillaceae bacterium]
MDKEHQGTPSRRNFLLAVGAGSVAAAAAVMSGGTPPSQISSTKDKTSGQGYRLTEHVRNYYRTAQV